MRFMRVDRYQYPTMPTDGLLNAPEQILLGLLVLMGEPKEINSELDISEHFFIIKEMDYHCIEKPYILLLVQY